MPAAILAAHEAAAHVWFHDHADELDSRLNACFGRLDGDAREEAVADSRACVWASLLSAAKRGRLDKITPFTAAVYARVGYKVGRRFAGTNKTDAMGDATRMTGRVSVGSVDVVGVRLDGQEGIETVSLADALVDPRGWDRPLENVRRNDDYPAIMDAENVNAKARLTFLMLAESQGSARNMDMARVLGVSAGRATQLKTILAKALARHGYRCPLGRSKNADARRRGRSVAKASTADVGEAAATAEPAVSGA